MAWILESRGRLRTAQGRFREGFAECMAAGERMLALDAPNPGPLPWRSSAALAVLGADDLIEARVARMAADGQTNREIAQAPFVTAGTVETHLSNTCRKRDIPARSQLAQALG